MHNDPRLTKEINKRGFHHLKINFQRQAEGQTDHTQRLLHEGLNTNDRGEWKADMQLIALKMVKYIQYEKDMVVTFVRGNYNKTTKRHPDEM